MVSTPYECPIYFSSLVAKWSVYRRIYHLQAREFIFPLPSVNYDVDLYTLQVSKSVTVMQHYKCCRSGFDGKNAEPTESTILKCINIICILFVILRLLFHTLFALVVVHWDMTGLLAEARKYGLLPANPVCLAMLSPSLDVVPRLLHLWELSVPAPSVFSEAPCFWHCNAMSVLRKVILDRVHLVWLASL